MSPPTSTKRTRSRLANPWACSLLVLFMMPTAISVLAADKQVSEEASPTSGKFDTTLIENQTVAITLKSGVEYEDV